MRGIVTEACDAAVGTGGFGCKEIAVWYEVARIAVSVGTFEGGQLIAVFHSPVAGWLFQVNVLSPCYRVTRRFLIVVTFLYAFIIKLEPSVPIAPGYAPSLLLYKGPYLPREAGVPSHVRPRVPE